jgi:hypothetical protein
MSMLVFWVIAPFGLACRYQHFIGINKQKKKGKYRRKPDHIQKQEIQN